MNERDFFYWLQGYFELSGNEAGLTADQVKVVKEHMALVAEKKTVHSIGPLGSIFDHRIESALCSATLSSSDKDNEKQLPLFNVPTPLSC